MNNGNPISRQEDYAAHTLTRIAEKCKLISAIFLVIDIIMAIITWASFSNMLGFLVGLIIALMGALSYVVFGVIITITLEAQANLLNNTYRTEKWLEKIFHFLQDPEQSDQAPEEAPKEKAVPRTEVPAPAKSTAADKEKAKRKIPVRVYPSANGNVICPVCKTEQNGSRYRCYACGQVFINGQPDVPYWCANCGHQGPFKDKCPECGGSALLHNTADK